MALVGNLLRLKGVEANYGGHVGDCLWQRRQLLSLVPALRLEPRELLKNSQAWGLELRIAVPLERREAKFQKQLPNPVEEAKLTICLRMRLDTPRKIQQ